MQLFFKRIQKLDRSVSSSAWAKFRTSQILRGSAKLAQHACSLGAVGTSHRPPRVSVMAGATIENKTVVVTGANRGLGLEARHATACTAHTCQLRLLQCVQHASSNECQSCLHLDKCFLIPVETVHVRTCYDLSNARVPLTPASNKARLAQREADTSYIVQW